MEEYNVNLSGPTPSYAATFSRTLLQYQNNAQNNHTIDWVGFVMPYRVLARLPAIGGIARRLGPQRLKVYAEYPFQVVYADWFDRLAAPIRFYYDADAMRGWLERARLEHAAISPTGLFGWRAYGERP